MAFASLYPSYADMTLHSRGALRPSFAEIPFPQSEREQGMPGACCTRGLVCNGVMSCAHEHTGTAGALRHSLRNGLTAYAVLSLETNSSCLHRCRLDGSIDPVGSNSPPAAWHQPRVSGPHGFAVRCNVGHLARRARSRENPPCEQHLAPDAAASTASRPAFVTTRDPPLLPSRDGTERATDLGRMESGIFLRARLDGANQLEVITENRAIARAQSALPSTRGTHPGCDGIIPDEN